MSPSPTNYYVIRQINQTKLSPRILQMYLSVEAYIIDVNLSINSIINYYNR